MNNPTMLKQLNEAKRYRRIIEAASRQYGLQPSVICGMGSRESHWGLGLTPPGPKGRGDFARRRPRGERRTAEPPDGPGYGRGLMQIDYDWHEFARTGRWNNPKENVMYACTVLDKAKTFFRKKRVRLSDDQMLRAMIAAYNGGATATLQAIQAGQDIDANTTGRDYSKDVLNRSGWFRLHGWR
jgi:soluble lytic murein transglycosylase-like protein